MRHFFYCVLVFAALHLAACSSLPRVEGVIEAARGSGTRSMKVVEPGGAMMTEHRQPLDAALQGMAPDDALGRHAKIIEVINGSAAKPGNNAQILLDGPQTWKAIFSTIQSARDHIHIESFIFEDLDFGQRLSDLLIAKSKQGVAVRVTYDSIGSSGTPAGFFDRLRENGVALCEFNPTGVFSGRLSRINHRSHRKIVVVDGRVGYTGGINFHSVYRTGSAMHFRSRMPTIDEGWRDTHVELRGSSVHELQKLFLDSWDKQGCAAQKPRDHFPGFEVSGPHAIAVVGSSPDGMLSRMYLALSAAMAYSRQSIWLTTAYFSPDPNTILALKAAVKRGVDVRILLPGFTDSFLAFHSGRSHYQELLEAGVKIYEQRDSLLHAKTMVIDGVWSSIGSSNLDWRSFCHNDEVNAIFLGQAFGTQMQTVFTEDLSQAHQVTLEEWQQRSAGLRLREWFARQFDYLL